jgi:CelD/BcsL family acetyltransferase involved in cellulose biosynthesis
MRHQVVRTIDEWRSLRDEWHELLAKSRANSLFMTWQWLDTWLGIHRDVNALLVVCIRSDSGELVGVAPHYGVDYALVGVLPYRVLHIVGDTDSGAEYQTWIAKRGDERAVFAEIVAALWALRTEWDLIWLPKLGAWTGVDEPLIAALRASRIVVNCRPSTFSAFSLPGDFDSYLKRMSANRRQQVRRTTKKLLAEPGVEIRKVQTREELGPALEALFDLHGKRWRAAGQLGVFARNRKEKEFYERFVPQALEQGWLALYTLFDHGQPKAVQIGYVYDGVFLQLQEGFDPDYEAHAGNALRATVIENCIKGGLKEYDFLGGTSEHKRRWHAEERAGMDLLAAGPALKNIPIMRAGVWPTGAYLRPRGIPVG